MRILLGITLLLASGSIFAMPAEEREETRIPILDTAEEFFGHRVNHLANDFDSFFATERADDELGRSRFRLRYSYQVEERALGKDDMQIRFNMRLPKLEQRFKFGESKADKKKRKEKKETEKERERREQLYRDQNKVDEKWLANADAGVNASIHPSITLRGRVRKSKELGTFINRFAQEVSWVSTRDGFRNRTTLDTDHSFTQRLLFRFNNAADWRISQKSFTTSHGPSLLHRLSDFDAVSYSINMATRVVDGSTWFVTNYQIAPTYRRNLYKELLYFDVKPGLNFPKVWSFRRTPFIFVQLELLLGGN